MESVEDPSYPDNGVVLDVAACGDCPACHTGAAYICESAVVPGFGALSAYAKFVAVPFEHNLVHLPDTITPA
ncbi:MAG: alcohol dehydrogenase catalytic domain-containing protein [Planktotalea sp.]|uniref:alcohol dehydrogenase catalytic domain-containing protein n=1 Tax=Planktotalea sp. TaxID=2029877 RepID=UPI00261AB6F0|nr:alcohol dehydrogenase catalytic domain-containing protein [Planktotalea sp.]MDG1077805.1 alcohol dehydrogenase catalytic domain-containing protein [Planktotalea sp.]